MTAASINPPKDLFTPSSPSRTQLAHLSTLLHLIHARNRNQHRRSHWYRHFSSFRREIARLCNDLAIPLPHGRTSRSSKSAQNTSSKHTQDLVKMNSSQATARITHWEASSRIGAWHRAFTHLVATTQYSALGLALLATLARVAGLTGFLATYAHLAEKAKRQEKAFKARSEGEDEDAVRKLLKQFEEKDAPVLFDEPPVEIDEAADLGQVVQSLPERSLKTSADYQDHERSKDKDKKAKKKKKKTTNAIDALFSGL